MPAGVFGHLDEPGATPSRRWRAWSLLSEALLIRQWLAIVLVIVACAGAARAGAPQERLPDNMPPPPA